METRKWGFILIAVGALMLAFVLLASPLHIYGTGFGTKHIIGVIVSAVVLLLGIVFSLNRKRESGGN